MLHPRDVSDKLSDCGGASIERLAFDDDERAFTVNCKNIDEPCALAAGVATTKLFARFNSIEG